MSTRPWGRSGAITTLLLTSHALPARADPATVEVSWVPCLSNTLDPKQFERALSIELPEVEFEPSPSDTASREVTAALVLSTTSLRVAPESCDSDESTYLVELRFLGPERSPSHLSSTVSLHDVAPSTRPRALAVATAELLRIALEGSAQTPPAPPKAPAEPPTEGRIGRQKELANEPGDESRDDLGPSAAPPRRPSLWTVELRAGLWARTSALPAFLGGGLMAGLRPARWLDLRVGGDASFSEGRLDYLSMGVTMVAPQIAVDWVLLDLPRLTLGPRFALPIALVAVDSPWGPESSEDWTATCTGGATLSVPLGGPTSILVSGEVGAYLRELELVSGSQTLARFSGLTGAVTLGLTVGF
ncbi:MAG TPA: hypothetical protein VLC09_14355 [Polyangiaceae bacterium]|nr:hypothetical protein [Polyangiaceae bacterium]